MTDAELTSLLTRVRAWYTSPTVRAFWDDSDVLALCDEVERLVRENAGLQAMIADLEAADNEDDDCLVSLAARLQAIVGSPSGMSLPEQWEHALAAVERLQRERDGARAECERLRTEEELARNRYRIAGAECERLRAIVDRLHDETLADSVASECRDDAHDDRWCSTCHSRENAIAEYRQQVLAAEAAGKEGSDD